MRAADPRSVVVSREFSPVFAELIPNHPIAGLLEAKATGCALTVNHSPLIRLAAPRKDV
jgi:hypothetical protein